MSITKKPAITNQVAKAKTADELVTSNQLSQLDSSTNKQEGIKRLTIDIPASLHRTIKLKSVNDGVTMVELIRQVLQDNFAD